MTTLAQLPPMQIVCAAAKCRRRQNVPMTDVYAIQVKNRSGGSHKDAATVCRHCGAEMVIPASFLRKGVLPLLPTLSAMLSSRAPVEATVEAPAPKLPVWSVGPDAAAALDEAIERIRETGGDMVGLTVEDGYQETVDLPIDREAALRALDESGCHLLVACGPNADGSTWQVVMHPASGAATMTSAAA